MFTVIAQGLFTSTGWMVLIGVSLASLLLNGMVRRNPVGRRPRWLGVAKGLLLLILVADLLLFSNLSGEGKVSLVVFVAILGAYLLLTKSGRSVLRPENRHAGRPTPVPHIRRRLTIYVVVTTLAVLVVALPLSFALVGLLESHAAGLVETLEAPIITAVFSGLMFAALDCLWRWLEGPRARRL